MNYKVLNGFMEKKHNNTVYRKGDIYPQDGFKADLERVNFLQEVHPTYGVPFLEKPKPVITEPDEPKKPKRGTVKTIKIED